MDTSDHEHLYTYFVYFTQIYFKCIELKYPQKEKYEPKRAEVQKCNYL